MFRLKHPRSRFHRAFLVTATVVGLALSAVPLIQGAAEAGIGLATPTNLVVTESNGTVTATWTAVNLVNDGLRHAKLGSSASGYTCTLMYGYSVPSTFTVTTPLTTCSFTGLSPSVVYGISVVSFSGGSRSAPVTAFPLTSPSNGSTSATTTSTSTTTTWPTQPKTTITCVKGKVTKKVTAIAPTCPAGYKLKR